MTPTTTEAIERVERPPIEHDVKLWMQFYDAVESGEKPFEVRVNDRDYRVGDTLLIREWSFTGQEYTGRFCRRKITYLTEWGQKPGYVALGLGSPHADALRIAVEAIENEPHGISCHWINPDFLSTEENNGGAYFCTCWKSRALTAIAARLKEGL